MSRGTCHGPPRSSLYQDRPSPEAACFQYDSELWLCLSAAEQLHLGENDQFREMRWLWLAMSELYRYARGPSRVDG